MQRTEAHLENDHVKLYLNKNGNSLTQSLRCFTKNIGSVFVITYPLCQGDWSRPLSGRRRFVPYCDWAPAKINAVMLSVFSRKPTLSHHILRQFFSFVQSLSKIAAIANTEFSNALFWIDIAVFTLQICFQWSNPHKSSVVQGTACCRNDSKSTDDIQDFGNWIAKQHTHSTTCYHSYECISLLWPYNC